jgi:hypothetical protein
VISAAVSALDAFYTPDLRVQVCTSPDLRDDSTVVYLRYDIILDAFYTPDLRVQTDRMLFVAMRAEGGSGIDADLETVWRQEITRHPQLAARVRAQIAAEITWHGDDEARARLGQEARSNRALAMEVKAAAAAAAAAAGAQAKGEAAAAE